MRASTANPAALVFVTEAKSAEAADRGLVPAGQLEAPGTPTGPTLGSGTDGTVSTVAATFPEAGVVNVFQSVLAKLAGTGVREVTPSTEGAPRSLATMPQLKILIILKNLE